jgi:hypothetical protein
MRGSLDIEQVYGKLAGLAGFGAPLHSPLLPSPLLPHTDEHLGNSRPKEGRRRRGQGNGGGNGGGGVRRLDKLGGGMGGW